MHIFFSVGEPSGDEHAAHVIRALRRRRPDLTISGFGGPQMRRAGCEIHQELTTLAVVGFFQVIPLLWRFIGFVRQAQRLFRENRPDAVVLVDFPVPGQKCIGFLTRTMSDASTGRPLAAVLVPNAINPTSAFLQILPMERVIETDLTMEQAMSMVMTGGAVGPETIQYSQPPAASEPAVRLSETRT